MAKMDVRKASIALGLIFALWHLSWLLLLAIGGDGFLNWVESMHMLSTGSQVMEFNIVTAVVGVVLAFVTGAITGAVFAYIWNKV